MRALPGEPFPLGATWDGQGVNFSLFSEGAERVELCLFDHADATHESHKIELLEQTNLVWHTYLPGIAPGQLYGYRVHGPYQPENGLRFNPGKILLDPYAKAIGRNLKWADELFGYQIGDPGEDLSRDSRDSAPYAPLAAVIEPGFEWSERSRPVHPWHKTVIYETHVRGISCRHPEVPERLRGTYAGLASPPILRHLKELGVTAVEMMPVHYFIDDRVLLDRGLSNYWGYNTLGFFAVDPRYSSADTPWDAVREFKEMVKALHVAEIEVILDVVYNHTAEGNHLGPTLSFRGLDNAAYYRLVNDNRRYYMDYTGCGNTLNIQHPKVLQLIMDSLRYWATEMHVDGFRFDLAAALAREFHEMDKLGVFFDVINQDPVLSQLKMIAEPWDLGSGGYQVGNFPVGWAEWNGKYRDAVRRFWRGDDGSMTELATRICGSSDLYEASGRKPSASINFVTAHDGFTLHDLVSYSSKHNEANLDENRDGTDDNLSANYGAEGPVDDANIRQFRERQKRNFLATLLLSQGVPMISGGDEIGRTQNGNNNSYCQDNELAWYDWRLGDDRRVLLEFTQRLLELRRTHPNLCRRNFFQGRPLHGSGISDITWLRSDGQPMTEAEWSANWVRAMGVRLDGNSADVVDARGHPVRDNNLLLLFNAGDDDVPFKLPTLLPKVVWEVAIDTSNPSTGEVPLRLTGGSEVKVPGKSLLLLVDMSSGPDRPRTQVTATGAAATQGS
jgi:glycogen operon protein